MPRRSSCDVSVQSYTAPLTRPAQRDRDRPKYKISREQLQHFVEMGFTISCMSEMLGVSKRTVERRLHNFGIRITDSFSSMSDRELDEKITSYKTEYPDAPPASFCVISVGNTTT